MADKEEVGTHKAVGSTRKSGRVADTVDRRKDREEVDTVAAEAGDYHRSCRSTFYDRGG